jgi:hypothetical protein
MEESASKEHWKNCYGTLLDDFLGIDARLGDIFIHGFAVTADIWYVTWHTFCFLSNPPSFYLSLLFFCSFSLSLSLSFSLKTSWWLGGTRFLKNAWMLCKRLLGAFA